MSPSRRRTRRSIYGVRLFCAKSWLGTVLVFLCSAEPIIAKPQISADCPPTFNATSGSLAFYLWYNVSNSNESSWDSYISYDEYYSDETHVAGYPIEDPNISDYVSTYITDQYPAYPSHNTGSEPFTFSSKPGTFTIYVSGEWNGASCSSTYSTSFECPSQYYYAYYQCNSQCVPCCYAAPALSAAAAPSDWSVQVLGRQSVSSGNANVTLEITNSSANEGHVHFVYTVLTRQKLDDEKEKVAIVLDQGNHRMRPIQPSSGPTFYTVGPYTTDATTGAIIPTTLEVQDLTVPIPNAPYVFVDIFAVNTGKGEHNSIALPRMQVYP